MGDGRGGGAKAFVILSTAKDDIRSSPEPATRCLLDTNRPNVRASDSMNPGGFMLLVREIMYCKPGKVRPLVEKFIAMNKLSEKVGMPKMRIMTDLCGERYWTCVSEMQVDSMKAFEEMFASNSPPPGASESDMKEFENLMKGYHDLVEYGRREIYKIEA
jgi:hypothetical protein